jgi:hypothetical protein
LVNTIGVYVEPAAPPAGPSESESWPDWHVGVLAGLVTVTVGVGVTVVVVGVGDGVWV